MDDIEFGSKNTKFVCTYSLDIVRRPQNLKKIAHLFWRYWVNVKTNGFIFQIFVAFSKNLNFILYIVMSSEE